MYSLSKKIIFLHVFVLATILVSLFGFHAVVPVQAQSDVTDGNKPVQSPVLQPAPVLSPSAYRELVASSMPFEGAQAILPSSPDTRTRVTPTSNVPWQHIAQILFYYQGTTQNPNPKKICTGFFIGPYTVATAGHCVYDPSYPGGWAISATVVPAMDAGAQPFGTASAHYLYSTEGWRDSQNPLFDYGAVYLTSALGDTVDWFDYGYFSDLYLDSRLAGPAYIAGYPLDKDAFCLDAGGSPVHAGCLWSDNNSILSMTDQVFSYAINTDADIPANPPSVPFIINGGEDGAPIWINDNGSLRVIGLHMFNASDSICSITPGTNCGLRITPEMATNFATWSEITPVTNCVKLTLAHTGQGSDPVPYPLKTAGCGQNEYVANTLLDLTATPIQHWKLDSWTGTSNDSSTALTNTYTTTASPHTISVAYSWICFSLTTSVNTTAGGSLYINPAPNCRSTLYGEGTPITIVPSVNTGYGLQNWSGDYPGNSAPLKFDITKNTNVVANFVAANGAGMYDDMHAAWQYTGTWGTYSGAGPYNNTDHFTSAVGGTATFNFYGSGFVLRYITNTNRGSFEVWVDGALLTTINAYSTTLTWQKIYTSPALSTRIHTVVFKNIGPAGQYTDIDAIQVMPPPDEIPPSSVTSFTAATGTANGTINLSWKAPFNDVVNASSGPVTSYAMRYSLSSIANDSDWAGATVVSTGLPVPAAPGTTQTMTLTGLIPGLTYYIALRGQDAGPNLGPIVTTSAVAKSPTPLGVGKYDDTNTAWMYTGAWTAVSAGGPYNGTNHYTTTVGDSAMFTFNGGQFILSYVTYTNRSLFEVWVDGALVTTVNAYSSTLVWQKAYISPVYSTAVHTVQIKKAGTAGTFMDVDAIQIVVPDIVAPSAVTSLAGAPGTANGSINLNWGAPMNDAGNPSSGPVAAYLVRHSSTNIVTEADWGAATVVASGIPAPGAPGAAQTMTISGLTPGKTYYIGVRGQDTGFNLGPITTISAVAKAPPPLGVGKYDDTHAGWTYTGSWGIYNGAGPYNNTNHYTTTVGDNASFIFSGSQFILSYVAYTNRGSFEVWVDGTLVTTLNAYSATLVYQKTYTSPPYPSGFHTVVVKKAGTSGSFTDVDAIEIVNPDLIAPGAVTSLAAVSGSANGSIDLNWSAPANDAGNPGSGPVATYLVRYSLANIANETDWNAATAATIGVPTPVAPGGSQTMTLSGLIPGRTYYIAVRGKDAGFNLGPIVTASAAAKAPTPLGVGKYDDTHTGWTYAGTWQAYNGAGPYNNTNHYTTTFGDNASFTFNGSQFVLSYVAYVNRGSFDVWVDGTLVTTVNAYNTALVWQKTYASPVFPSGLHTVMIKKAGTSGTFSDVDAIQIINPDLNPPDAVTSLMAAPGTANGTINLSWSAPANDAGNLSSGPVAAYQVRYSLTNIVAEGDWDAATPVTSGIPTPGAPGAAQTMTVTGLVPGTKYYIAVRGQDTGMNLGPIVTTFETAKAPAPLGPGKYDDTHEGWTYVGAWQTYNGAGPYNNTNHYTTTAGDSTSLTFNGSQFILSYVAYTNRGSFEVRVDGALVTTVNAYSSTLVWQKTYISPVFPAGTHTVVIKKTGTSGTYSDVDAIQIINPDLVAPDAVTSLVAAPGTANGTINLNWSAPANDAGNPGSGPVTTYLVRYSLADIANETDWNAAMAVTSGIPTPVAPGASQAMTVTGLMPGTNYYIAVRGQDTGYNLGPIVTTSATAKAPVPLGVGKYDDTHEGWTYSGSWQTYTGAGPYNNTNHYTTTVGDSASFTFSGGQFILWYVAYTNRGSFEVWVDGALVTTVNAYSSTLVWQKKYISPGYPAGTHTVMIKKVGTSGTYNDVDAIQIFDPDLIAPSAVGSLAAVTGTMGGSIGLSWTAPMNDDGNPSSGPVDSYLVRYSQTDIVTESDWNAALPVTVGLPIPGAPGTTQNMVVSGLLPGQTYYIAVRGQDRYLNLGPIVTAFAEANTPTPAGVGTYDDASAFWMYGGNWIAYTGSGPYNNTIHYSDTVGSTASFTFTGSQFIFWYLANTNRGSIEVSVDGVVLTTLNANGVLTWQTKYRSPVLTTGTHTAIFKFTGPSGYYVDVDAIQILP